VVHRDIKPDNIMLDSEGRCVITDFGIAKAPGGQQTAAGTSLGTPRYMSPEHAMGSPLDGRSDMYSLGVVAYQCLFGKTPFDSDDPFAVLYKHINEPVPTPTLQSDDERQLYGVIARMLAKKPDDRFQTGNELIAALGGQVSDPTLMASGVNTAPGLMAPTEKFATQEPWYTPWWRKLNRTQQRLAMGLGVGVAVAVLGLTISSLTGDKKRTGAADQTADLRTADSKTDTKAAGITTPVAPPANTDSIRRADSVAKAANTPPKPKGPSDRAAAIIAYNKLKSSCAKRDTLASSKPIPYAAHLDTVHDRNRADKMTIVYDVCGLDKGSPFTATFTLTKLRQGGLGFTRQKPHQETALETAGSPRSREQRTLNISEMSAGDYKLDVVVTDAKNRPVTASREFKIR